MNPLSNYNNTFAPSNIALIPSQIPQPPSPPQPFGHPITLKHPNSLQILLQNPNGISPDDDCFQ